MIATGSVPIAIPGFDFDEDARLVVDRRRSRRTRIPEHLVVIGGGYIGLELGIMYRKLGSQVTVIEATAGALPGQERDCVKVIERSLKKPGIERAHRDVRQGASSAQAARSSVRVQAKGGERHDRVRPDPLDRRPPALQRWPRAGARSASRLTQRGFLAVDERMRTAVPNIYAIGDIAGQPMLAHKGSKEGLVAAGSDRRPERRSTTRAACRR